LGAQPADGAVETARGLALLRLGKPHEAVDAFRRAVDEEPRDSTRRLNVAASLFAASDRIGAKDHAEKAIMLEPLLEDAYALLAEIDLRRAKYWKDRYQKFAPQRVLP
jgi:Flp pilus assembly protein TadD